MPIKEEEQQQSQKESDKDIAAWNAMFKLHGLDETVKFLALFQNHSPQYIIKIVDSFPLSRELKQQTFRNIDAQETLYHNTSQSTSENGQSKLSDFKSPQDLFTTTDAWNEMLNLYGPSETLAFLSTCNYSDQSIKFLTANLHLPEVINRVVEAKRIIDVDKTKQITDFKTPQDLFTTLKFLNKMIEVYKPNETLDFLTTCGYNEQSIKFLTANLHLPESMDRRAEAEKINKLAKRELSFDFKTNRELVNVTNKCYMMFKYDGPEKTFKFLSESRYRPKSIKLIMANLPLPKTMHRVVETERIIEANKKNILPVFKKKIDELAKKQLNRSTLNSIIDSYEFSKRDTNELKKEVFLKTQKEIEHDIKKYFDEIKLASKEEQLKNYIKQLQRKPNEIETYLDNRYRLEELKKEAVNGASNRQLTNTRKNKNEPEYDR